MKDDPLRERSVRLFSVQLIESYDLLMPIASCTRSPILLHLAEPYQPEPIKSTNKLIQPIGLTGQTHESNWPILLNNITSSTMVCTLSPASSVWPDTPHRLTTFVSLGSPCVQCITVSYPVSYPASETLGTMSKFHHISTTSVRLPHLPVLSSTVSLRSLNDWGSSPAVSKELLSYRKVSSIQ